MSHAGHITGGDRFVHAIVVGGMLVSASAPAIAQQMARHVKTTAMIGAPRLPTDDAGYSASNAMRPVVKAKDAKAKPVGDPGEADPNIDDRIKTAVDSAVGLGNRIADNDPFQGFFREVMVEPERDPLTGIPIGEQAKFDKDVYEDETIVDSDAFGPIGPGRRERLAEMAGMTPDQAKSLWPWPDPKPFKAGEFNRAMNAMGRSVIAKQLDGTPERAILDNLIPKDDRDAKAAMKRLILTPAEVSLTAYAALGLSLPIRVGRITDVPPDGIVVFNPELLRADFTRTDWKPRHVQFKWMNGKVEIYRGECDVETYVNIPRPTAPTSHVWVVADDDVMAYSCIGIYPPANLADARRQILEDVVAQGSYLRPNLKLYGLRWDKIPNIKDVGTHPQVKMKLFEIMRDLGMVDAVDAPAVQMSNGIPSHMAPDKSYQWKADYMREVSGITPPPGPVGVGVPAEARGEQPHVSEQE
jgi:hypothetical protein